MKPLFIPLKTKYYNEFASGEKTEELGLYGPRWNEKIEVDKGYFYPSLGIQAVP